MIDAVGGGALLLFIGAAYLFVAEPAMEAAPSGAERKASAEFESRRSGAKDPLTPSRQLAQLERIPTLSPPTRTPAQINRQIDA